MGKGGINRVCEMNLTGSLQFKMVGQTQESSIIFLEFGEVRNG